MRVMTWNVLTGGVAADGGSRWEDLEAVMASVAPDVMALQEANHFEADRQARLRAVAARLGLRGYLGRACTGYHVALFVPADWAVQQMRTQRRGMHHALLQLQVLPPSGEALCLLNAHLSPFDGQVRLREVEQIVRRIDRLPPGGQARGEALLMGDLNSLDHHRDHSGLAHMMSPREQGSYLRADGKQDDRVTRRLEQVGLVDLGWRLQPDLLASTVPTALKQTRAEFIRTRLDYVWATPGLAARAACYQVLHTPETERASDHYPVVVEFDT
jgi:exodeoxyribonuclease-3